MFLFKIRAEQGDARREGPFQRGSKVPGVVDFELLTVGNSLLSQPTVIGQ